MMTNPADNLRVLDAQDNFVALPAYPVVEAGAAYDDTAVKAELAAHTTTLADHEARIRKEEAEAGGGGGGTITQGTGNGTPFDSLGADDTARFKNLADKMRAGWTGEVEFAFRNHNCNVQIPTAPGRWRGAQGRAFEYGKAPQITYTGPSGTSMFYLYKNSGYSYPANGVSRDFVACGIQFNGGSDKDFLPPAPGGFDSNYVQWYWDFHDCGFVGWRNIFKGWGTGLDLGGFTNFQAMSGATPLTLGGSECKWFLGGGFMDSGNATWMAGDRPFIECSLSKSVIGSAMISARGKSYQLKVTYGHNTRCIGTEFDAPDGSPTAGHQARFIGSATNFGFDSCSFKGGDGILGVSGSTEIVVNGCMFANNRGLARLESGFNGVLIWGLNTYGGAPREIRAARANQVVCQDPRVAVKSLDGSQTFQQATR